MSPRAHWAAVPLIWAIRGYQVVLGPFLSGHCRFEPTCSHYGLDALREHGAWRGSVMTVWRLLRCQPFSRGGYDPVPPRDKPPPRV